MKGAWCRVQSAECRVQGAWCRVQGTRQSEVLRIWFAKDLQRVFAGRLQGFAGDPESKENHLWKLYHCN